MLDSCGDCHTGATDDMIIDHRSIGSSNRASLELSSNLNSNIEWRQLGDIVPRLTDTEDSHIGDSHIRIHSQGYSEGYSKGYKKGHSNRNNGHGKGHSDSSNHIHPFGYDQEIEDRIMATELPRFFFFPMPVTYIYIYIYIIISHFYSLSCL